VGVGLALDVCLELAALWLVEVGCGTRENKPVETPGAGALACADVGCRVLEFAAAESDEVYGV